MKVYTATITRLAALFICVLAFSVNAQGPELTFKRCIVEQGALQVDAECATLQRLENPADPDGKKLDLFVAKFASRSTTPQADAFTIIQGGPGGSSVDLAAAYGRLFEAIRAKRDILVIDQRGTGRSNMLACPPPENQSITPSNDLEEVTRYTKKCVEHLGKGLEFYTSSIAVQDLEALREASGYQQLTIYGVSYGTRVAQHYLRRFPERTRAVILDGVVPIGLNLAGGEIARRAQDAFDGMASRCLESPDCAQQFGDVKLKFDELRKRLVAEPASLSIPHPRSGKITEHTLTESDLLGVLRLMSYSTESLSLLPMLISSAHAGDYLTLAAQAISINESFLESYATGMNNSVMCAEDAPFVEASDLINLEQTYFGTSMSDALKTTCRLWPRGAIDEDFRDSFDSDRPILILSGETDPITPPENGELAHQMLSNSKHMVVPGHGHGVVARGCVPQLLTEFVETASFKELNTGCVERERAMPFFINPTGPKS